MGRLTLIELIEVQLKLYWISLVSKALSEHVKQSLGLVTVELDLQLWRLILLGSTWRLYFDSWCLILWVGGF